MFVLHQLVLASRKVGVRALGGQLHCMARREVRPRFVASVPWPVKRAVVALRISRSAVFEPAVPSRPASAVALRSAFLADV